MKENETPKDQLRKDVLYLISDNGAIADIDVSKFTENQQIRLCAELSDDQPGNPIQIDLRIDPLSEKRTLTIKAGEVTLITGKRLLEIELEFDAKKQFDQFVQYAENYNIADSETMLHLYLWTRPRFIKYAIRALTLSPLALYHRLVIWAVKLSEQKGYDGLESIKPLKWDSVS